MAGVLWLAYLAPRNPLRPATTALAEVTRAGSPRRLFGKFVRGLTLGLYRAERLRCGHRREIDAAFDLPEDLRLLAAAGRGAILMIPHAHAALPMVRGLACRFRVAMLVRTTRDAARSASQHVYYSKLGCEIIDVRRESEASGARRLIAALREGAIVIGTGDLIRDPPPADGPVDRVRDLVRANAFGQPVGVAGWPARFALKTGAPLVPVMPTQAGGRTELHLGPAATGADVVALTRDWFGGLTSLLRRHPADWAFFLDRRWVRVLHAAATEHDHPREAIEATSHRAEAPRSSP